jgi:hypothetical protein
VFLLFHDLIDLLISCGEVNHRGHGCGCNISLTLRANHEEDKLPSIRNYVLALVGRYQENGTRWDYLGYIVQIHAQSNNNIVRPRLIYNMMFP